MSKELLEGLPEYKNGTMSPNLYNAGGGLYDDRPLPKVGDSVFPKQFLNGDQKPIPKSFFDMFVGNCAAKGCDVCTLKTKQGFKAFITHNKNEITAEWKENQTMDVTFSKIGQEKTYPEKKTLMRTVTATSKQAFSNYITELQNLGYKKIFENQIENNLYYQLEHNNRLIYAYYMENTRTARFIDDIAGTDISTFGYTCNKQNSEFAAVVQYGLYHSPDRRVDGVRSDCGMFYIVKLNDNSVFIIDGAAMEECTDAAAADIMRLLHELTKTHNGEKIRVAAWFCTHAHGDHIEMFGKLIRFYHQELNIERLIFNFTPPSFFIPIDPAYNIMERVLEYYPNIRYLKCHNGQTFELGGVKFEVLQTHEDGTSTEGNEVIGNFNDTSTVMQISFDGKKFIVLGDMDNSAEKTIINNYSTDILKSDIVQVAHHLMNNLELIYSAVSPEIALVPQHPVFKTDHNSYKYETLCKNVKEENIYFDTLGTVGFKVSNNSLYKFLHYPLVGGEYDGSEI